MNQVPLAKQLTIDQLYELWSTDPDLVRIWDLRPDAEREKARIPGVRMASSGALLHELRYSNRDSYLHVLIVEQPDAWSHALESQRITNAVVVADRFDAWTNRGYPVVEGERFKIENCIRKQQSSRGGVQTMKDNFVFYQLFESETSTYTYLLGDQRSKEAVLIDPVLESVDRDLKLVEELGLKLVYVLDTHIHADHVTGAGEVRARTGAKTAVSALAQVNCVDIPLVDGQELRFGEFTITALATPGHTDSCMSFYCAGQVFTGDSLLIRGTGRTDFQQGSAEKLYESVASKLFTLPAETIVYPGHDYRGQTRSTIGMEKLHNPRLGGGRSKADFIKTMAELKLPDPKRIAEAVPANLSCGQKSDGRVFHPQVVDGIPEITPEDLNLHMGQLEKVTIIDVRRPDEFNNELGHIRGAKLLTLETELVAALETMDRSEEIVFVCRSGARSGQATAQSLSLGFQKVANMIGGMLRWNELRFPTERES